MIGRKSCTEAAWLWWGVQDFEKGHVKQFTKAVKHYDELADRLNKAGHSLSVFACSLDQVGLAEMHPAVHYTGKQRFSNFLRADTLHSLTAMPLGVLCCLHTMKHEENTL